MRFLRRGDHQTSSTPPGPPPTGPDLAQQLADARAEIARLRAGEDPTPCPEGVEPNPGQWYAQLHALPAEKRCSALTAAMADRQAALHCRRWEFHERQIAEQHVTIEALLAELETARQWEQRLRTQQPTCDASVEGMGSTPLGPCVLRANHHGPVHRSANGATWWLREGVPHPELDGVRLDGAHSVLDRLARLAEKRTGAGGTPGTDA
jgi:hypothetical protein